MGGHDENVVGGDCLSKAVGAGLTSAAVGGVYGAIKAAWITNPQVKDQSGPMLRMTFSLIKNHMAVLAAVGAIYTGTECALEAVRNERDWINSLFAGAAAGSLFGVRAQSPKIGFGCAAILGVAAVAVDLTGGHLVPPDSKSTEWHRAWTSPKAASDLHH